MVKHRHHRIPHSKRNTNTLDSTFCVGTSLSPPDFDAEFGLPLGGVEVEFGSPLVGVEVESDRLLLELEIPQLNDHISP